MKIVLLSFIFIFGYCSAMQPAITLITPPKKHKLKRVDSTGPQIINLRAYILAKSIERIEEKNREKK